MRVKNKPLKRLNHYSKWKYLVLITTCLLLALSALPSWYGEKPAIELKFTDSSSQFDSPFKISSLLDAQGVKAESIALTGNKATLVFNDEADQTKARNTLNDVIGKGDSLSYSYTSIAPAWLKEMGFAPIKLGLDLRGGVQFLLNVDVDQAISEQRDAVIDEVKQALREQRIFGVTVSPKNSNGMLVRTKDKEDEVTVRQFINSQYPEWLAKGDSEGLSITLREQNSSEFLNLTMQQNLKIMRQRIEELGITEALVQRQGESGIRIELPGVQDPSMAKRVIGATASLAFYEVKTPGGEAVSTLRVKDEQGSMVVLVKKPVLTGEHIVNARVGFDQMHRPEVDISLDHMGGKMMSDFSATHIGKPMATVYREYGVNARGETQRSEKVISVATIQSQLGSQFRITGSGDLEEAQQLALLLRAGSLTAPVTIVEERTIGASLGAENIQNGFAALALGLGLTLTFMALWYRRLGWVANVALMLNMSCLLGLIALVPGAVLTLPGIAGLVLTVGMAVDTNVLIFERIRDKLAEGRSFAQAIDQGFNSAVATILDANITTMITAVILYSMGNGPIQGFALTLGLGLLTSMFTGIFVSRAIINLVWGKDARREVRV
ncbi:protein translocase subunit SecD [Vibrio methylphosphonaticus]|uniref:protein translocase subunit SecD n=1 Tax=Vibrio methylphosphonaticus TaxID=2946866 RepID=UPI00202A69B0|nr:protein translocase subunit SecD [Vibrio methylphosphonaticus]MCL9774113.1 protein translocase subunit SecD [Vibrio methylphosphonaticus]